MPIQKQSEIMMSLLQEVAGNRQALIDIKETLNENSSDIKQIRMQTEKTYHTVYGNGQPGLVDKVSKNASDLQELTFILNQIKGGSRVISFVWGGVVGIIGFLFGVWK